ncbi:MAG: aminotransferase class V-fold PLP-dependent enzyme [Acidobacteriia bacterium]|nr:aminotransferase class V-fold PLP-dependent enzyme [Terriglobia bacterium]
MERLFSEAAERGSRYLTEAARRRVAPRPEDVAKLEDLGGPLPQNPSDPTAVIAMLDDLGSRATMASTSGRYFGFVTGGALPVTLAANWLAGAWDQNAGLHATSPLGAKIEEIAAQWLCEIFGLPDTCGVGFTTGATMANFTCLAAARHALLKRAGWNVEDDGLFGAPPLTVVVGAEVHVSLLKALSMLGLGRARVITVPADEQGRMKPAHLPALNERTIVCMQAGNVNTGAFDPAAEICARAQQAGAWVHVDGAFGLWAAAAPHRSYLLKGICEADSWGTDCHKWLNVPYDCGVAFVRDAQSLRDAMIISAAYLHTGNKREPAHYSPEASRRARGVEVWAAIRSLGRSGLAELIERNCQLAKRFAQGLRQSGFNVLNDVVLNQVLVSFGSPETTRRVIADVQSEGTCWCGGTEWHGHTAMRISVSCWATTEEDVEASLAAIVRIARRVSISQSPG